MHVIIGVPCEEIVKMRISQRKDDRYRELLANVGLDEQSVKLRDRLRELTKVQRALLLATQEHLFIIDCSYYI